MKKVLRVHHVPNPESMELMEMLSVPMMLTMYLEALDGRKLLKLNTRDELMEEYLSVLTLKEARNLLNSGTIKDAQNSPAYYGAQVAVNYVLPEIAALIGRKKRALTEKEIFQCIEECYKYLDKKAFTGVFEKWIGHTRELKLDTKNADEWYGRIVQDILWKKLGLLVVDEEDHYRIIHQIIEEYMEEKSKEFHVDFDAEKRRQRNYRRLAAVFSIGAVVLLAGILFGFYNWHMNTLLAEENQEILRKESSALAFESQELLDDGDRLGAIETALEALPTEDNDRPFVAAAEKSLADALYAYQEVQYRSAYQIALDTTLAAYDVSEDGSIVVTLDNYGSLKTYVNGALSWAQDMERVYDDSYSEKHRRDFIQVKYLAVCNSVVVIREWFDMFCYDAATGDVRWTYSKREDLDLGYIQGAEFSSDLSLMAVYGVGASDDLNTIYFIDTATGDIEQKVNNIGDIRAEDACFMKDDTEFVFMCYNSALYQYALFILDVQTGELIQDPWVESEAYDYKNQVQVAYIPEYDGNAGGIFIYICEYNMSQSSGSARIGYLADDTKDWRFYNTFTSPGTTYENAPEIYMDNKGFIILVGPTSAVKLNRNGGEIARITYGKSVVYQEQESEGNIRLFFDDGTTTTIYTNDFELSEYNAYTYAQNRSSISSGSGCRKSNQAFACILEAESSTLTVFQLLGDDSSTVLEEQPGTNDNSYLGGDIYPLPDQSGFLYLDDESEDIPEGQDASFWYQYSGILYDCQGKIQKNFSFEGPFIGIDAMSKDGMQFYFDDYGEFYIYDLDKESVQNITYDSEFGSTTSKLVGDDVITLALSDAYSLIYWTNGENPQEVSLPIEIKYFDTGLNDLVIGKEGIVILPYDSDDDQLQLIIYDFAKKEWEAKEVTVRFTGTSDGNLYFASGVSSDALAMIREDSDELYIWKEEDKNFHIIDQIKGSSVEKMQYILDDQYLLVIQRKEMESVGSEVWISILSVESGEIVYEYHNGGAVTTYTIFAEEDSENSRLFLSSEGGDMTGLCIDTTDWETIFEIPNLRCIFTDTYISSDLEEIRMGKIYSLEEMISEGKAVVNTED